MKATRIERTLQGIVVKKSNGQYGVQAGNQLVACTLSTRMDGSNSGRKQPLHQARNEPLVIGDEVFVLPSSDGMGRIVEIRPRRSQLSRRSAVPMPGAQAFEQVIAANVDQIIPVFAAANPQPHWNMLDRYLVSAESQDIPAVICVTKQDLIDGLVPEAQTELDAVLTEYRKIGYPVFTISSRTGEGLEAFRQVLHGKISVFLGKSGVGKTSLLNAIQPGLGKRVSEVNQVTGKGRHTTTYQEMFSLESGGAIIDTPGEREFGLWEVDPQELALFFPEMRPYLGRCRFGLGCRHDEEPGCAVRRAVMDGRISPRRYQSYVRLREDP